MQPFDVVPSEHLRPYRTERPRPHSLSLGADAEPSAGAVTVRQTVRIIGAYFVEAKYHSWHRLE